VFALLITEGLTRIIFHRSMDFDMEMWKYATQIKTPSDDEQMGYEHRPNGSAFLMGAEIKTNSFGLRGEETTLDKPADTYRVLVMGDSITLGWGVENEDTYPVQLAALLNGEPPEGFPPDVHYEVLNLGIGNYNTVQEVSRLRQVGLAFDPDLIVLGYFINDAEPTPQVRQGVLIEKSYLYVFTRSRLRTLDFESVTPLTYEEYYSGLYDESQPGWQASQAALGELASIAEERGVPVAMFIIPELHDLSAAYPFADIHDSLEAVGAQVGLPVVDLYPVFSGYSPEEDLWVSPTDAHHNAEAQAMIANGIYDALDAGLIEP
jgi:lysophospholipase L1-like esterase